MIINISSISARRGDPGEINYAAAKATVEIYFKSLASAVAPENCRVNTVSRGPVTTTLWTDGGGLGDLFRAKYGLAGSDAMAKSAKHVPLGRFAEPENIADLVVIATSEKR